MLAAATLVPVDKIKIDVKVDGSTEIQKLGYTPAMEWPKRWKAPSHIYRNGAFFNAYPPGSKRFRGGWSSSS